MFTLIAAITASTVVSVFASAASIAVPAAVITASAATVVNAVKDDG